MQNDLISRSALITLFEDKMFNNKLMAPVIKISDVLEIIEEQPTAYDLEKVVEKICGCDGCSGCCNCHEEQRMMQCEEYKRVYDMVRNGGKE